MLKDQVLEDYEKTRKKKDPDLNRDDIKPRLPEDVICQIVQARIESPACMNKGFVLDGFPKSQQNAQAVFYSPDAAYQAPEDAEEGKAADPLAGLKLHEKILPQYAICLEADDAFLKQRMKDFPADKVKEPHWEDKEMDRRLKPYREANGGESNIQTFFEGVIG